MPLDADARTLLPMIFTLGRGSSTEALRVITRPS